MSLISIFQTSATSPSVKMSLDSATHLVTALTSTWLWEAQGSVFAVQTGQSRCPPKECQCALLSFGQTGREHSRRPTPSLPTNFTFIPSGNLSHSLLGYSPVGCSIAVAATDYPGGHCQYIRAITSRTCLRVATFRLGRTSTRPVRIRPFRQ